MQEDARLMDATEFAYSNRLIKAVNHDEELAEVTNIVVVCETGDSRSKYRH